MYVRRSGGFSRTSAHEGALQTLVEFNNGEAHSTKNSKYGHSFYAKTSLLKNHPTSTCRFGGMKGRYHDCS